MGPNAFAPNFLKSICLFGIVGSAIVYLASDRYSGREQERFFGPFLGEGQIKHENSGGPDQLTEKLSTRTSVGDHQMGAVEILAEKGGGAIVAENAPCNLILDNLSSSLPECDRKLSVVEHPGSLICESQYSCLDFSGVTVGLTITELGSCIEPCYAVSSVSNARVVEMERGLIRSHDENFFDVTSDQTVVIVRKGMAPLD